MKRVIFAGIAGVVVGSVGTIAIAYSIAKAEKRGSLHTHPFMKASAWATSKLAAKGFDPDTASWR